MTNQNFPRGGREKLKNANKSAESLIKKHQTQEQKKSQKKKSQQKGEKNAIASCLNDAKNLTMAAVQPNMNILGRVHKVMKYDFVVNLPGFLSTKVSIADVSSSYNNILKQISDDGTVNSDEYKRLDELYKPGDYVVCNVLESLKESKFSCKCSIAPAAVNANVNPSTLTAGCTIVCSIGSVEDHGFVMETGLSNVRAFLEKKYVENDANYYVGKQLLCFIKKVTETDNIYTLKLSQKPKHEKLDEQTKQPIDNMIPGSKYELTVNRILPHGLEVLYNSSKLGYINQIHLPKALKTYEKGIDLIGTLMYTIQLYKFPFFTTLSLEPDELKHKIGDIINSAKFYNKESGGIILKLSKGSRGYVSNKRTAIDYTSIEKTFVPHSKHRCRIISYGSMDRMYVLSMEKSILEEKFFSVSNLEIGSVYKVNITHIGEDNYVQVRCGRLMGMIPPLEIRDRDQEFEPIVGKSVMAKVLNFDESNNKVIFSTRTSILEHNLAYLKEAKEFQKGEKYLAIVKRVKKVGLEVRFLGGARGWIGKENLKKEPMSSDEKSRKNYYMNQVLVVEALDVNQSDVVVCKESSMNEGKVEIMEEANDDEEMEEDVREFPVGTEVEGTVVDASPEGVHLQVAGLLSGETAFLPAGHMSPCEEIGNLLAAKTQLGNKMSAKVFANYPKVILTTTIVPPAGLQVAKLKCGFMLPISLLAQEESKINVILPVDDFCGTATTSRVLPIEMNKSFNYKIKFGIIRDVNKKNQSVYLDTSFEQVWNRKETDIMSGVDLLALYLNNVYNLSKLPYFKDKPLSSFKIGQKVKGKVTKIVNEGLILELNGGVSATVKREHFEGNFKIGDQVLAGILWINYVHEFVEATIIPRIVNSLSTKRLDKSMIENFEMLQGNILLVNSWMAIVQLKRKAKNTLVALPIRRHPNDVDPDLKLYDIHKKIKCYGVLHQDEVDMPLSICMLKSYFERNSQKVRRSLDKSQTDETKNERKRKAEREDDEVGVKKIKGEVNEEMEVADVEKDEEKVEEEKKKDKKKRKREAEEVKDLATKEENGEDLEEVKEEKKQDKKKRKREAEVKDSAKEEKVEAMPECGFYWDTALNPVTEESSSSSEDDSMEDEAKKKKKKKLTAAERRELERQKERAIREREEYLATGSVPTSVDQFDRLVLAQPNSAMVWVQYMMFHLQQAEIDKARTVAKRALDTINFREEEEKLAIWKAWLNLESKYGTVDESLKKVFDEAVKMNDAAQIYQHMLTIHAEAGRVGELENVIKAICGKNGKFKQDPEMWIQCGAAYLKVHLKEKSRLLMQRALQSLPPQQHVNVIIRFAYLENKFGDSERCQTLFEQVLSSYPKRTDIWLSYVDIAVKAKNYEMARKILERAINQPIPPKKMKSIFQKYLDFETQHGTPDKVNQVRKLAANYVEKQCN